MNFRLEMRKVKSQKSKDSLDVQTLPNAKNRTANVTSLKNNS
jgi:hypothetical protein